MNTLPRLIKGLLSIAGLLLFTLCAHAELRVADIFQSMMVLQRDKEAPVWGWADPGAKVEVSFDGQSVSATADSNGAWMAKLSPMKANAKGQTMTITSGGETLTLDNVLVGEVWVAAGQSNMNHGGPDTDTGVYPHYVSDGNSTAPMRVRSFGFGAELEPVKDFPPAGRNNDQWEEIKFGNADPIPHYFARVVRDGTDVPVGMIRVAYSGTNQAAWMSKETLEKFDGQGGNFYLEYLKEKNDDLAQKPRKAKDGTTISTWDELKEYEKQWLANPQKRWPGDGLSGMDFVRWPTALYNTRIYPLAPYAIRGVIWHQGEGGPFGPYGDRLIAMFTQWRELYGQDFYVIWGTLSDMSTKEPPMDPVREGFYRSNQNEEIRKAYEKADDKMEFVEFYDLGNQDTHFAQKAEGGRRMGLAALDLAYNQDHIYTGPRAVDFKFDGPKAYVKFEHTGERLIYEPSIDDISGVVLIGKDGERAWGNVEVINEDTIQISHPSIREAGLIAYANSINPHETLFNSAGLPASPFSKTKDGMGRVDEPKTSGEYLKVVSNPAKANIHLGHMRRNGYQFEPRARKGDGQSVEVQAYIPSAWSGYEVWIGDKQISANKTEVDGRAYAEFSAPVGQQATVCEAGQYGEFRNVNRY